VANQIAAVYHEDRNFSYLTLEIEFVRLRVTRMGERALKRGVRKVG
jgi:hypothetical protein